MSAAAINVNVDYRKVVDALADVVQELNKHGCGVSADAAAAAVAAVAAAAEHSASASTNSSSNKSMQITATCLVPGRNDFRSVGPIKLSFSLNVNPVDTIEQTKLRIADELRRTRRDILFNDLNLYFNANLLNGTSRLNAYNIHNGSNLNFALVQTTRTLVR
jgi:hypothetical protein